MNRSALQSICHPAWLAALFAGAVLAAATFVPNNQPYGYQAPVALSKPDVEDGAAVAFVPWFEASTFGGELLAAPVSPEGLIDLANPHWRASQTLGAQNWDTGRRIVTRNDATGAAVPFRFGELSLIQQASLVAEPVLNYVRGDRSGEGAVGLRERSRILGDIIHSNPEYVGRPRRGYVFDNYLRFAADHHDRAGRVYVGANDGMLHAFDAASGEEVFAYVPSMVIPHLAELAANPYLHRYFVDGPLVAEDAYFGDAWHTVLVGGLSAGGKGLFALDVTLPDVASEAAAASRVLWEFSDDDSDRLGYTYSRPSVVKLNTGRWAVVTGNGYMSDSGRAALMIIDLENGTLVESIEVDDDDNNGLSSPALIDTDGDFDVDVAYAGDLNGNLWKFDLSSADSSNWEPAWDKEPLFVTEFDDKVDERQPITTAPTVGFHPKGGYFVYVATGRLLDEADAQGDYLESPHSVYGIRDDAPAEADLPFESIDLLQQRLYTEHHAGIDEPVYTATANAPDWNVHRGWATALDADGDVPGTRVITDHVLRSGRLHFVSTDPSASGDNFLMQLDANTGGAPNRTVIDIDRDGTINVDDNVDGNHDGSVTDIPEDRVVGQYQGFGSASQPRIASIGADDVAIVNHLYTVTSLESPRISNIPPAEGEDAGLIGGHIDLDTSSAIYDFDDGETDKHVHEWDDKYDSTVIDFFDILGDGFTDIDEPSAPPSVGSDIFILTVANAHLSPGAVVEINGAGTPIKDYRAKIKRYLNGTLGAAESFPRYKLTDPTPAETSAGVVKLTDFRLSFAKDTISRGGVHPTKTGCVKGNEPGQNGEYRNGALTMQALDANDVAGGHTYDAAIQAYETGSHAIHDLGYAVSRNGGFGEDDDRSLFWEATIFWHWGGDCFGAEDKEAYDAEYAEEVGDDNRGTDADIEANPPAPPAAPPGGDGDGPGEEESSTSGPGTTTTRIAGQEDGRLSWRELMIDE